ncbi:MAG: hypothetical protein WA916_08490 [Arcobacter sp.]|uniref:hypothetical protein n=1 Tax=Arcobacter sp. TaxID=1872629 RepID=UPI003C70676B
MSNELELFTTPKSTEITNNSKITQNNSQKKEAESLFDKFLTKAKTDIENVENETKSNVKEVKKDTNTDKSEKTDTSKTEAKNETKTDTTKTDATKTDAKTTSLMDRLIQETKSNVKEVKKDTNTDKSEKTDNSKIEAKTETKVTSLSDSLIQDTKSNVKEIKKDTNTEKTEKTDNSKTEIKTETKVDTKTTSLINNLVQETSENTIEVKKDSLTQNKDKLDSLKKNLPINDIKSGEINVKTDSKSENKIDNVKNSTQSELNNLPNKKVEKEVINQKTSNENADIKNQKDLNLNKPLSREKIEKQVVNNINENSKTTLENDSSKTLNPEIKNQKVGNDLSKLNVETKNEKTTLSNETPSEDKNTKNESLIDKLLKENGSKKESTSTQQLIKPNVSNSVELSKSKNDLLTNIYMSTQKKSVNVKKLETKHEGVEIAKNATTTKEVEQSAKVLNLGLEKVEVKIEKSVEPQNETKLSSTFERLSMIKNGTSDSKDSKDSSEEKFKDEKGSFLIQNKKLDEKFLDSKLVNLTVSSAAAQTIQNRIIGARQHMSTMMSDLARVMYENYNPPVTAFRVNLNPSALGNIAILIRGDARNNSLSISMKSSNNSTKENLVENQSMLKDSLFKSFAGGATSFDLDFGSYEGDNTPSENPNMNQNKEFSSETISANNKREETEVKDSKYM